ncbi:MAG: SH3 domain-containing protein [Woeseiaceae bacterium]
MRLITLLLILLQNVLMTTVYADDTVQVVKVADPFLEVHTGASVGYPIFHVVQRDETISILKRRTNWYLINTKDKEGWVHRSQLVKTLTLKDEKIEIKDFTRDDYADHTGEMSMIGGNFGGLPMMTLSTSYTFTSNLSTEVSFSQIIGSFSSRSLLGISLVQQPFPEWRVSPYFSIGTGMINTKVKSTLSQITDRTDIVSNVNIGAKMYLTRRFLLRADLKKYIIFQSRDKNEEISSWQVGFAFFY